MIQDINLRVSPRVAAEEDLLQETLLREIKLTPSEVNQWKIIKRSIDARKRNVVVNLTIRVASGNDFKVEPTAKPIKFTPLSSEAPDVVIVGAGPAGLFAALKAITLGIRPIVIERGKDVDSRRLDIANISREVK